MIPRREKKKCGHTYIPGLFSSTRLSDLGRRAGGTVLRMSYPVSRYSSPRLRPLFDTPPERIPMSADRSFRSMMIIESSVRIPAPGVVRIQMPRVYVSVRQCVRLKRRWRCNERNNAKKPSFSKKQSLTHCEFVYTYIQTRLTNVTREERVCRMVTHGFALIPTHSSRSVTV